MNPEIELFLQEVFKDLRPNVQGVGRVLVEPDYESSAPLESSDQLAAEMKKLLSAQKVDLVSLKSHAGFEVDDLSRYPELRKLVLRVSLHEDAADGPWIEVAPPGNWI